MTERDLARWFDAGSFIIKFLLDTADIKEDARKNLLDCKKEVEAVLRKQLPMSTELAFETVKVWDTGKCRQYPYFICPLCRDKCRLPTSFDRPRYCPECGQRLDWGVDADG